MATTRINNFTILIPILLAGYGLALTMTDETYGVHAFGDRVENDRLIYQVDSPHGHAGFLNFKFTGPPEGPIITCVEVVVHDIYNETLAYISSGDIGKRAIVIVLGVLNKKEFSFTATVYGL